MTAPDWDSLKPAAPNWDDLRPADHGLSDIREKAIAALPESMQDVARKALSGVAPSWTHNPASYSPYKPANPNSMPNDAINPVGTDTQMVGATAAAGAGSVGARMLARATEGAPPGPIPDAVPNLPRGVGPGQSVQLQPNASFGAQMNQNIGRATGGTPPPMPAGAPLSGGATPPPLPAAPAAGSSLARQVGGNVGYGLAHNAADLLPFPLNTAAHMALRHPKVLGLF